MLLSTPEPSSSDMNNRGSQEKKRRIYNNTLIDELRELVQDPMDSDLSIDQTLKRAFEVVTRLERESSSDPTRGGFFQGISQIESLTITFIQSIGMNSAGIQQYTKVIKEIFAKEYSGDKKIKSNSGGGPSPPNPPPMDRKAVKKCREQDRRDRHSEGYNSLNAFIFEHTLLETPSAKLQKTVTLEIIIKYIKDERSSDIKRSPQDELLYTLGVKEGQKKGKSVVIQFFKKDRHLLIQTLALEMHLEFHTNPQPLQGFVPTPKVLPILPTFPALTDPQLPLIPQIPPLNLMSLLALPAFQNLLPTMLPQIPSTPSIPLSPTGSLGSPPSSSDGSSPSSSNSSSNNSSPTLINTKKTEIFRPWC